MPAKMFNPKFLDSPNLQMVFSRRQGARPTLNAIEIYLIRLAIYVIRIFKDE